MCYLIYDLDNIILLYLGVNNFKIIISDSLVGEILGGRYDIWADIGKGGSSFVYLAKKLNNNERYAMKTISTDEKNAIKFLERETDT
ncbi:hypothetical protein [Okeania sp.]|uniref:hypothetical protein n=1 Tax=Okeania sp. TaxID=3100323 RepID=UPI002B4B8B70|nr:hypothetical protein [Okeania sp.]MEB3343397.1 hypothetical protein [Okeania sp.]